MISLPSSFPWDSLLSWYREHGRHDLEWRDYSHERDIRAYRVWLSEIFLQQTQVERVRGYFTRIVAAYPTVHDLARASYEEFFPYYQGMWYYSRARNLLKTAKMISEESSGHFPEEKSLLMKLPGVWWYTSSAILAFAFDEPYLAWDTNLEKVFSRYYHGRKDMKLSNREKEIIEADFRWFLKGRVGYSRMVNNALMDFASLVDLKNPLMIDWTIYPIRSGIFYETEGSLEPNEKKKSENFPTPDASIIVVLHRDHREYYSSQEGIYTPFVLPPAMSRESRAYVQWVFRERYGMELSVRPPYKKWITDSGRPYIALTAQIQTGDEKRFSPFMKSEAKTLLDLVSDGTLPPWLEW